jgi:hypothetical protein
MLLPGAVAGRLLAVVARSGAHCFSGMTTCVIDGDRYFLSQLLRTLKAIRAKIRPEQVRELV